MTRRKSLFSAALALMLAAGAAFAQNGKCPRTDCPNPGQNCPRNGQGQGKGQGRCMRQGNNAKSGPAGMNQGMRRGRMMMNRNAVTPPAQQDQKK